MESEEAFELLDWRRRIFELYRTVRMSPDPQEGWWHWRRARDELFVTHPQSPIPKEERHSFKGLHYFDYDERARFFVDIVEVPPTDFEIGDSAGGAFRFTRFGRASFELSGEGSSLDVFWLDGYSGGIFVPFRDATSGKTTYGAARYLFDTAKGADLGGDENRLVFDFNFAYQPSCSYDPKWVCPLAPPANVLDLEVNAGEMQEKKEAAEAAPFRDGQEH